ncbi:unnamed protein product [Brassicogethes aeneus]|uniref:Uncharacterized protein n=1 Tax=Brassicogethes aeneus TaxID=1431903 RepID=A0A9P0FB18_BRAAE|nr:unnamed protein product [Brassicogethes aeneus]
MPEKEADFQAAMSAGLPMQFPSAFAAFHAPLPVDQRTHEGRYVWDPRMPPPGAPFHPPAPPGIAFFSTDEGSVVFNKDSSSTKCSEQILVTCQPLLKLICQEG